MSEKNEQRLAEIVVRYLQEQHWEVYQEVKFGYGGIADIAAVRAGLLWIVECKTSMTFKVLEQASGWRAHFRSVAVPRAKGRDFAEHIATDYLRVGILDVDGIYVHERPAPFLREHDRFARRFMGELREEQKTWCKAGSSSGGYFTPYRDTMTTIKRFVASAPGCTLGEIMACVGRGHYANLVSARSCIPKALESWEKDWCRVEREGKRVRYFVREREGHEF